MSEPTHDPELTAVARALAGLAPAARGLNRDALMFAAGRTAARRGWGWPGAAVGSALAATVLAALLLLRPAPQTVVRVVYLPAPPRATEPSDESRPPDEAPPPAPRPSPPRREPDYLTLRQQVERWGDAGLPHAPFATAEDRPAAADDALDLPPDARADPWLQRRKAMLKPGGPL